MSAARRRSAGSRRLIWLFLAVLMPPAVALAWLGARVLDQDRRLLAEADRQGREIAADAVAGSLADAVALARASLDTRTPLTGVSRFRLTGDALTVEPAVELAWTPLPVRLREADKESFDQADLDEFAGRRESAARVYRQLVKRADARVRAGALVRLARVHRAGRENDAALAAYTELATIRDVAFDQMPADLLARRATCGLLHEMQQHSPLAACASALERDLVAGQWALDHAAWQHVSEQVERWTGRPLPIADDRRATSVAAEWLWRARGPSAEPLAAAGRRVVATNYGPATIEWTTAPDAVTGMVMGPELLTRWIETARVHLRRADLTIALLGENGQLLAGPAPDRSSPARVATRDSAITGLPWQVVLSPSSPRQISAAEVTRRWTLGAGLAVVVIFIGGGGLLIWRVVQREIAVARLQTDFVSAVSHEFRTPLTSLQHAADLLDEDDHLPPTRRRLLFDVIGRSTTRLSGLVESLLDFARMEGGRQPYHLALLNAGALATKTVNEFIQHAGGADVTISVDIEPSDLAIRADEPALARALWNLLENAVKYSHRPCTVDVAVRRCGDEVGIAVSDHGPGIPRDEQREVFQKFVRGADALKRRVPGTGLGLAIVSHIVKAHGGRVHLESAAGAGSTFTMTLPAAEMAEATGVQLVAVSGREDRRAS